MQFCNPDCLTQLVQVDWNKNCDLDVRKGGISRLVFLVCDPAYVHPYPGGWGNLANIQAAICNNKLYFTGEVLGQKPKGSFTKKRMSSCSPERIISATKTLTFQDYNADKDGLTDFDFWNGIVNNAKLLKVGWITCDDRFYQVESTFDIEIDEVTEDTNDGNSYFDGTITFQSLEIVAPIVVTGLNDLLSEIKLDTDCYAYLP